MTNRTPRSAFVALGAAVLLLTVLAPAARPVAAATKARAKARPTQSAHDAGKVLLAARKDVAAAQGHCAAHRDEPAAVLLEKTERSVDLALATKPEKRIRDGLKAVQKDVARLDKQVTARRVAALAALPPGHPLIGPADPAEVVADSIAFAALPPTEVAPAFELPLPGDEDDPAYALPALDDDAIAVEEHPLVDKWLDYFTGRGRPTFERWLERSGQYVDAMKLILEKEGVPTDLVHLVFVESGFNPQARSVASAVGPWQFIRGTANIFGLRVNSWVDERKDPEASTIAAARYLKHLYGLFNSWPLALASYNAGEGAVGRAIKRQGTRDFWALRLPEETRNYVPKFMAVLAISRDPSRYGFDQVAVAAPLAFDEVSLPGPVDLRALAAACETDLDVIKHLNPQFLRHAAPPRGDAVMVRVPDGAGERLMASLAAGTLELPKVAVPADPLVLRHKVRRGESLKGLGLRYGVSPATIAKKNRMSKSARLRVGRTLLIPQADVAMREARPAGTKTAASASGAAKSTQTVKVRKGQTLSEIAVAHGVTVAALREANGLSKSQSLQAGQRLRIPRAG